MHQLQIVLLVDDSSHKQGITDTVEVDDGLEPHEYVEVRDRREPLSANQKLSDCPDNELFVSSFFCFS
jgi:hypothetical protein